jgi:signal transduction histidine kinase
MLHQFVDDNIDLDIALGKPIGKVRGNPEHLGQVLLNLVINARDAMPTGGTIDISTSRVGSCVGLGDCVRLKVSDTGTGMSGEVAARVFEPFFTTKRKGHGTGLGLATCATIVKQHGGQITVHTLPGQGSTFEILLPETSEQEVHQNNRPGQP